MVAVNVILGFLDRRAINVRLDPILCFQTARLVQNALAELIVHFAPRDSSDQTVRNAR